MQNSHSDLIHLYDTTLRDGTQGEGINFSTDDKLRIARLLDDIGFSYIEGGYPASNERDREFFAAVHRQPLRRSRLCAFGMTMRATSDKAENDPMLQPLVEAQTPAVTVVGKTWDLQVTSALRIELNRNIEMIEQSVAYLRRHVDEVVYDAEHFFDGWKHNRAYALTTLQAAQRAGADWLVLCDTNGGTMPWEIESIVAELRAALGPAVRLGIHCHNDTGNGVACSLAGIRAGSTMVHGTVGGIGERTGNADLVAITANLELKMNRQALPDGGLAQLSHLAYTVFDSVNQSVPNNLPYVGASAFAHKGGMHTSAVARDARTYEHISPDIVGNRRRFLVSDLAGKATIRAKLEEFGYRDADDDMAQRVLNKLKTLENDGYEFEGADASLDLLFAQAAGALPDVFEVRGFRATDVHFPERAHFSEASIELTVDGLTEHTAAFGNGPVNTLDNAFRKALQKFFPALQQIELLDYKVRVLSGAHGTGSKVRVVIASGDGHRRWQTVGVSTDVIDASYRALVDSYRWYLARAGAAL